MVLAADILDNIVPISTFSRGGAAKAFAKAKASAPVIVVKNNEPIAVVSTPEEYARLSEAEENYVLLCEALYRIEHAKGERTYTRSELMAELGITQEDIDAVTEDEIEFD